MGELVTTLLLAALATNAPAAPSNRIDRATGFSIPARLHDDSVEQAYRHLLAMDDAAQAEMDRWIQEADTQGTTSDTALLERQISERIGAVDLAYRSFLEKHSDHVDARVAYGSFLNDTGQESGAKEQWEKAQQLDPKNAAVYNNLAGIYGHRGPVTNAFAYYERAIELDPKEPVYYQNFATTVFLFRPDVMGYYGLTNEQKVFDKALALYRKALELDPANFILASDIAQTYYGITPPRGDEALAAWQRAYELASDDLEREGIRVHLARLNAQAGRFDAARVQLGLVTHTNYTYLKERVGRMIQNRESAARTNAPVL